MTYLVNTAILDSLVLRDDSNTAITGLTLADFAAVEAYLLPSSSSTATVTITEVGLGEYSFAFTPSEVGTWALHVVYDSGGVFREGLSTFAVVAQTTGGGGTTIAVIGAQTTSRQTLRRRIADRMGDLILLNATSESLSNTTFVDSLNISGAYDNLTGRMFSVATGANAGHVGRITASTESTNTINFVPPASVVFQTGDEIEVVNERSRGWTIPEYNRAINAAINDAFPLGVAEFAATISGDFAFDSPFITVPETMNEVYEVAWQDPNNSTWIPLRAGTFYGWTADATAGTIAVLGAPALLADGTAIRLAGYGRHPELSSDTDVTSLNPEWIVARSCYHLSIAGAERDNARANLILLFQREAEGLRGRVRTMRKPGTVTVRQ